MRIDSCVRWVVTAGLLASAVTACNTLFVASSPGIDPAPEELDRTVLPIPEPKPPTYSELSVRNAKAPPRFEVKPPKGAPCILIPAPTLDRSSA